MSSQRYVVFQISGIGMELNRDDLSNIRDILDNQNSRQIVTISVNNKDVFHGYSENLIDKIDKIFHDIFYEDEDTEESGETEDEDTEEEVDANNQ
jgi:hypothetical protein